MIASRDFEPGRLDFRSFRSARGRRQKERLQNATVNRSSGPASSSEARKRGFRLFFLRLFRAIISAETRWGRALPRPIELSSSRFSRFLFFLLSLSRFFAVFFAPRSPVISVFGD